MPNNLATLSIASADLCHQSDVLPPGRRRNLTKVRRAAENFLNNFDSYASEALDEARAAHRPTSIRNYSTGATPLRVRPSNERLHSHESSSRRHTPRTHESPRRHPSGNTSPAAQFGAPSRTPLRTVDILEDEAAVVHRQYSPSHGLRAPARYEDQQETWRSPT